jgi:hypothetical protein
LSDDKTNSLIGLTVSENDRSKGKSSNFRTPKVKRISFKAAKCCERKYTRISSMNSDVNSNIFEQQNKRSRDNRSGSPSAVTSTADSSPLLTVDKTQMLTKRKLSEDSPQGFKKLRSPLVTPRQGLDFSTLSNRKFSTPHHNDTIDQYFTIKEIDHLNINNSKSSCVHENTFESVAHIPPNSHEADCIKNYRSPNSSEKTLQHHVDGGECIVDSVIVVLSDDDDDCGGGGGGGDPVVVITDDSAESVIVVLSDDDDDDDDAGGGDPIVISDESDAENLIERKVDVTGQGIYELDTCDSHDIESTEIKTCTATLSDESHTKRAYDSDTQNVYHTDASAQENMHFTCRKKELVDSPDLQTVYVQKPVSFDVPDQEQVGSSCSDESTTINSLAYNSTIFSSPTAEAPSISSPGREPVFVSGLIEPEVLSSCDDDEPFIVTGSYGDSKVVNNKSVIGSREAVSVNCVTGDSVVTVSSDKRSLISCSISGSESVSDNSPHNENAFVYGYWKPAATEQPLTAKENVLDPVVVGECGEKLEVTCDLCIESFIADTLHREPTATDRPVTEPVVVDMYDKGPMNRDSPITEPLVVNKSGRKNVIVDKPERDLAIISAIDKGCVTGDQDRKLVVPVEEGSLVGDSTDTVNLNEGATFQHTSENKARNCVGTSGSYDKYPNTSTSARDGEVGGLVTCDQVIAAYQAVMYDHHDRAATCLELRWVPFCCQYPYSCTQQHKNSVVSGPMYTYLITELNPS